MNKTGTNHPDFPDSSKNEKPGKKRQLPENSSSSKGRSKTEI
jgi:hypothetical protein